MALIRWSRRRRFSCPIQGRLLTSETVRCSGFLVYEGGCHCNRTDKVSGTRMLAHVKVSTPPRRIRNARQSHDTVRILEYFVCFVRLFVVFVFSRLKEALLHWRALTFRCLIAVFTHNDSTSFSSFAVFSKPSKASWSPPGPNSRADMSTGSQPSSGNHVAPAERTDITRHQLPASCEQRPTGGHWGLLLPCCE